MHVCGHILYMQVEKIKLPSEKDDNPIGEVLFYKKPKVGNNHMELLSKKEVQEMVNKCILQSFILF